MPGFYYILPLHYWYWPPAPPTPTLPYVTVANAAAEQAMVSAFGVADTAAHILTGLGQLAGYSHLTSLRLTDATSLAVDFTSFATYQTTLDKLVAGESLTLANLSVVQAAAAQADAHVSAFTVSDTAAHVQAALATLNADAALTHVTLSDGLGLTLTGAQAAADGALLGKLAAGTVTVTGAAAQAAASLGHLAAVAHETVADTLAHIGANLDALEALAKSGVLTGISVTDSGQTLTLTPAQYAADHDAIALLHGNYTVSQSSSNFTINLVWDASVANAPAGFKAAVQAAAQYFESVIHSSETVTLDIGYGEVGGQKLGAGTLGEAGPSNGMWLSYAQLESAVASHGGSQTQAIFNALGSADFINGGHIYVASAEAKALGLMAANAAGVDGVVGFAADPSASLFSYDPANRGVAGKYDFIGVAEHEISHALGRIAELLPQYKDYSVLDLTRFSAPGVHDLSQTTAGYFSVDGGKTNLDSYATSSDLGDWASSAGNDANTAYAHLGVANLYTAADVTQLAALGYALS